MSNEVMLAGFNGGVRVFSGSAVALNWAKLKEGERNGNYWASIVVKQIQQLTAGRLNNEYAYVRAGVGSQGNKEFYLILPGCKVTAEARTNGNYFIANIDLDETFFSNNNTRNTGLYFSKSELIDGAREWSHLNLKGAIKASGNLKAENIKIPVGISDAYSDINNAAKYTEEHISNSPHNPSGNSDVKNGFNLFYTKGTSKFGGLLSMKEALGAAQHKSLHEPALLLAEAMHKAASTPVVWVTQRGGSAVLAQALGILRARGTRLPQHQIYLSNPTSSQTDIYRLAQAIEIKTGDKFASNNLLSVDEFMGGMVMGAGGLSLVHERQKTEAAYGWRKAAVGVMTANGDLKAVAANALRLGGMASVGGLFGAGFTLAKALAFVTPAGAIAGAVAGVAALGAANIPGLKDYSNPGKLMLKKMGFS